MPSDKKRAERVPLSQVYLKFKLILDGLEKKHLSDFKQRVLLYSCSHSLRKTFLFLDN